MSSAECLLSSGLEVADVNVSFAGVSNGSSGLFSTLAVLPENTILTEKALATALGVSTRTIRRMVERYELPPPFKNAGRSCWMAGMVLEWLREAAARRIKKAEAEARKFDR